MNIDALTADLEVEANWDFVDLMGGSDSGSQFSIHGNYGRPLDACSVVRESVPLSVVDLLLLAIRNKKAMSRVSILEEPVKALRSTLSTNNTGYRGVEVATCVKQLGSRRHCSKARVDRAFSSLRERCG